ncbi:MAG: MoaD/ThiS family protein [Burkholderiales bacterium]|nr:MoaD/ThiS family protein [Burkholderiales bacterium]
MNITFKLYASLTQYLPPEVQRVNQMPLEVSPEASIADIVAPFNMPPKLLHLVLVNGVFIPPEERASRRLAEGDVLAIWPPIAGG